MTVEDLEVHPRRPHPAEGDLPHPGTPPRHSKALVVAVVAVVVAGVVARFLTRSQLWLDEALTVNIARLPPGEMFEALRHDGAPPLYYLLLHGWMDMAGTGDVAARALSGTLAVASLPLMWLAGRRLGGERRRWVAWVGVLLLASSPFAIRYATEVRMYSLVIVLVLAGYLALDTVLHRRSPWAAVGLAAATGMLLLTHYWAFYLVAAVGAVVASQRRRLEGAGRALAAMAAGSLLFLPWLPSFLEQMRATGTPWGGPPRPRAVFDVVLQFAGGLPDTSLPLGLLLCALLALGLFGAAEPDGQVRLDLRGRPPGRGLAAAAAGTMTLAVVVGQATGSAFAVRYAAVVFPLVVLVAALGTATLAGTRAGPALVAAAVALGFVTATPHFGGGRTSAGRVAAALRSEARPGDVVAYCPDQLGPAVSRLLAGTVGPALVQVTFPRGTGPEFVDWVDYEAVNRAAATAPFARMLLDRAGPDRSVWVVWTPGYRTFGTKCQGLLTDLRQARPGERRVVTIPTTTFERPGLVHYPGAEPAPAPTVPR